MPSEEPPSIEDLIILPKKDWLRNQKHHLLCKVEECKTQGRSDRDDMCKRHFTMFKNAGRSTKSPAPDEAGDWWLMADGYPIQKKRERWIWLYLFLYGIVVYVGFGCVNSKISYLKWHYELRVLSEHRVVQEEQQRGILLTLLFSSPEIYLQMPRHFSLWNI